MQNQRSHSTSHITECYFTPRPGSGSCRDCRFSFDPSASDPGCLLPHEAFDKAIKGEAITITPEVLDAVNAKRERYKL